MRAVGETDHLGLRQRHLALWQSVQVHGELGWSAHTEHLGHHGPGYCRHHGGFRAVVAFSSATCARERVQRVCRVCRQRADGNVARDLSCDQGRLYEMVLPRYRGSLGHTLRDRSARRNAYLEVSPVSNTHKYTHTRRQADQTDRVTDLVRGVRQSNV